MAAADLEVELNGILRDGDWFDLDDTTALKAWLADPDAELLNHNQTTVRKHFSLRSLPGDLRTLFAAAEDAGLKVVMNRCPKIEYGKLSGEWGWVGGYSGALSSQRQRLHASGKMQSLGIAPRT